MISKIVKTTTTGRLKPCRRFLRSRVGTIQNPAIIKKRDKYWIKIGSRLFRVYFDNEELIDESLSGIWSVEGAEILKKRRRILIKLYLSREVKVEDKPKTIIRLSRRGNKIKATAFKGKKVVDSETFKYSRKLADKIIKYAGNFKRPIIVSKENIPTLSAKAGLRGIEVTSSYMVKERSLKPVLACLLILFSMVAMAVVYNASYGIATITVQKKVDVNVSLKNNVIIWVPGIGTKYIGDVNVTVYGSPTNYSLTLQLANLNAPVGCRFIAVQVYDGANLIGIISPLTPSLIINEYNAGSKTYQLKLYYVAFRPCEVNILIQATVELI